MDIVIWAEQAITNGLVIDAPYVVATLAGAGAVIAFLFFQLVGAKDKQLAAQEKAAEIRITDLERQIADLRVAKEAIASVGREAIAAALETANYYRDREGSPPIRVPPRVATAGETGASEAQREGAGLATARATIALIREQTGQAPSPPPEAPGNPTDNSSSR